MHIKRPKIIASVLVKKGNRYLLTKEVLESKREYWLVPGGHVEFGENLETAAKREIEEETGLRVKILKLIDFKEVIVTKYDYHTVIFFFMAKPIGGKLIPREKALDAKFFTKKEMKNLRLIHSAKWLLKKL